MNIDKSIVARALAKAGQEPLNDDDIKKNSARWRVIKEFYLSTILETLSQTEWTSQKKRKILLRNFDDENLTDYNYCYFLPEDCAKPEELKSEEEFMIEGNLLYTNDANAILMFISNGKRIFTDEDEIPDEDYPEYDRLKADPLLNEYIETRLASKIVLKITGDMNLYGMLYNESLLKEQKAVEATRIHAHSKLQGDTWWADEIGLGGR